MAHTHGSYLDMASKVLYIHICVDTCVYIYRLILRLHLDLLLGHTVLIFVFAELEAAQQN